MSSAVNLLKYKLFARIKGIEHGVSKRAGGVSEDSYNSLNLSYNSGDNASNVLKNRAILASTLNVNSSNLLFPDQCHTNRVVCVGNKTADLSETDALITNRKGIAIGVLAADCIPLLFYDIDKGVIAAAHAGWRGTVKQISVSVLKKMQSEFNTSLKDVIVGIGPCIQKERYEVGPEVILEIEKLGDKSYSSFIKASENSGHAYIDLQGINKHMLIKEGISESNIEVMDMCTFSTPKIFFSARRDGFQSGRFGSVIMLK